MRDDVALKLLQLTSDRPFLRTSELETMPPLVLESRLTALIKDGLLTISNGVLRMDGTQRILLAERLIHAGSDPRRVSRFLKWQEFEDFTERMLRENGFLTRRHFVFKSQAGRREIDVLAWNDTFMLAIDCKHWLRGLAPGRLREVVQAQIERTAQLAQRPELLGRLRVADATRRSIIPLILTLSELHDRLVDRVPVVSVSKLLSFLYGLSPVDDGLCRIGILNSQSRLA